MKYVAPTLLSSAISFAPVANAQIPHILGNWDLNVEASLAASEFPGDFAVPPIQSEKRTYYRREDGFLVGIAVTVLNDGTVDFLQFTAKTDGEEYPEYNGATLSEYQATGTATRMMYSETSIDEYTVEVIDKSDGNVTFRGTRSVSEDGNTMTIEWEAIGPGGSPIAWKQIYDRVN